MSTHDQLLELIPAYALGALDRDEMRRVEEHLDSGCDECERELLESTREVEAMAQTVEPQTPSDMLRARLDRALDERAAAVPPSSTAWWKAAAVIALALITAWSLWSQFRLRQELDTRIADQREASSRLTEIQGELARTRDALVRLTRAGRIVSAPSASSVLLAGLESTPEAQGSTFVDPNARAAVFYASDLPELSEAETYQLWFIADGVPVSGGTFDVDDEGRAMVIVDQTAPIEAIQLWAVTIEPAGGVPQPTGEMVLKS